MSLLSYIFGKIKASQPREDLPELKTHVLDGNNGGSSNRSGYRPDKSSGNSEDPFSSFLKSGNEPDHKYPGASVTETLSPFEELTGLYAALKEQYGESGNGNPGTQLALASLGKIMDDLQTVNDRDSSPWVMRGISIAHYISENPGFSKESYLSYCKNKLGMNVHVSNSGSSSDPSAKPKKEKSKEELIKLKAAYDELRPKITADKHRTLYNAMNLLDEQMPSLEEGYSYSAYVRIVTDFSNIVLDRFKGLENMSGVERKYFDLQAKILKDLINLTYDAYNGTRKPIFFHYLFSEFDLMRCIEIAISEKRYAEAEGLVFVADKVLDNVVHYIPNNTDMHSLLQSVGEQYGDQSPKETLSYSKDELLSIMDKKDNVKSADIMLDGCKEKLNLEENGKLFPTIPRHVKTVISSLKEDADKIKGAEKKGIQEGIEIMSRYLEESLEMPDVKKSMGWD